MHTNRNPQHGTEGNQVRADVAIRNRAVVGAPVVHHVIGGFKRPPAGNTGSEPGAGPGIVSSFPQYIRNMVRQIHCPAFGDLDHRANAFDQVKPGHGNRHFRAGKEARRKAAAPEIAKVRRVPGACLKTRLLIRLVYFPEGLYQAPAI